MTKYYANRPIHLGKFAGLESVHIPVGAELEYDGTTLHYKGKSEEYPFFDAVLKAGWVSTTPVAQAAPKAEKPSSKTKMQVDPEFQVAGIQPSLAKTKTEAKKPIVLVGDDDERIVATNISNKGIVKKPTPAKKTAVSTQTQDPEGDVVSTPKFKSSTNNRTVLTP